MLVRLWEMANAKLAPSEVRYDGVDAAHCGGHSRWTEEARGDTQ